MPDTTNFSFLGNKWYYTGPPCTPEIQVSVPPVPTNCWQECASQPQNQWGMGYTPKQPVLGAGRPAYYNELGKATCSCVPIGCKDSTSYNNVMVTPR